MNLVAFEACIGGIIGDMLGNTPVVEKDERGVDILVVGDCPSDDAVDFLNIGFSDSADGIEGVNGGLQKHVVHQVFRESAALC